MFNLIPAPGRLWHTVSMWLLMFTGVSDCGVVLLQTLTDMHLTDSHTLGIANAGLIFLTGIARFFQQQIALTTAQKVDIVTSVANAPVRDGHEDIDVAINGDLVTSNAANSNPDASPLI